MTYTEKTLPEMRYWTRICFKKPPAFVARAMDVGIGKYKRVRWKELPGTCRLILERVMEKEGLGMPDVLTITALPGGDVPVTAVQCGWK